MALESIPIWMLKPFLPIRNCSIFPMLCESIRENGVMNPILVRKVGDLYEVINGQRRVLAAVLVGIWTIPANVVEITDKQIKEMRILESPVTS